MDKPPPPDPAFDGHLERPISKMSPEEKLDYLSKVIDLTHFLRTQSKRLPRTENQNPAASESPPSKTHP
jgi:hypothetical protein